MSLIHLSEEPHQFVQSLEIAIKTVRSCRTGISFLAHFVDLIQTLRRNPITASWVKKLEGENQKHEEELMFRSLNALESEWLFLWEKYPQRKSRRQLIRIRQFFTKGIEQSSQLPFEHTCFSFREFKVKFGCNECSDEFTNFIERKEHQILRAACNPKIYPEYIQSCVEIDVVYFWRRLCLLERIYQFSTDVSVFQQKVSKEKWDESKYFHWKREESKSLQWVLGLAKKFLDACFEGDGFRSEKKEVALPLSADYKFSRTDCESYLDRLSINILPLLSKMQTKERNAKPPLSKKEKRTLEVGEHASKYWGDDPEAKHKEVYRDYKKTRRGEQAYEYSTWVKIVQNERFDPRSREKKTRRIRK